MDEKNPLLRVAVISDSQAYPTLHDWGMSNLEKAFQLLAPMKPDVLLMAGDLADHAILDVYDLYRERMEKYFSPIPVHVGCAGNHDYWVYAGEDRNPEYIYSEMSRRIGQKNANPLRETIGGYDFIALSEDIDGQNGHSPAMLDALEKEIQAAVARDNSKPVFVVTHFHPFDTVSGSHTSSGRPELRELFNRYKQVVSISGHTHCPLEDERCIWQGEFTAINSSTLAYGCVEEPCYNNCSVIIPFAREVVQVMVMEIFDDHFDIHRYNVEDRREIKPEMVWSCPIPYIPEEAKYTLLRKNERSAPEFPADAQAVIRYDFGYLYLIFDPAYHDDFVHFYNIKLYEKDGDDYILKTEERYISDFYRLQSFAGHRLVYKLPTEFITPDRVYRVEIYPVETFGNTGKPLVIERKVPNARRFYDGKTVAPQE
ncbi:MAG: metallophosphoesterase [Lentisphaeria bacterium]|nr:metallophosphoesterase [Lentisphaeria bacterium]